MLIRDARLVALTGAVAGPVDVRIEAGRVVEVGPGLTAGTASVTATRRASRMSMGPP